MSSIMAEQHNVELPKFKRSTATWEGKVIEYLLAYPSGKTAIDLLLEGATSYWVVEALEGKVSPEEFRLACRAAAENLSKKLTSIQQLAGLNTIASVPDLTKTIPAIAQRTIAETPQQQEDNNDIEDNNDDENDDDWNMNLQPTPKMIAANKMLQKE
ncbi:hypothetical protein FNW02_34100 [Komarekiella sp. 'clone 1']|uniref:Uncharacterized protein n=1 Tax=Komarekiella delphini-convector SJRDD-AB1 TaxID=2593771 RepID=A0AA40VUX3_9NOST|nr:hypothetical protein [Komarekiella delphini-convector]MBD6620667.1 hypothetical protein [Komarekiella delphini-convector SJRDD-AB1]